MNATVKSQLTPLSCPVAAEPAGAAGGSGVPQAAGR